MDDKLQALCDKTGIKKTSFARAAIIEFLDKYERQFGAVLGAKKNALSYNLKKKLGVKEEI